MKSNFFQAKDLCQSYGDKVLFKDLNLTCEGPSLFLISGDNGTGKSTLLKGLSGFHQLDKGQINYNGHSISQLMPGVLSYAPATTLGLNPDLNGEQHIKLFAAFLNISRNDYLKEIDKYRDLKIFEEVLEKKVLDFSQGMKQVLRLFLHTFFHPEIIMLDEPFMFLAPNLKEFILGKILDLSLESVVLITDQDTDWIHSASAIRLRLGQR